MQKQLEKVKENSKRYGSAILPQKIMPYDCVKNIPFQSASRFYDGVKMFTFLIRALQFTGLLEFGVDMSPY